MEQSQTSRPSCSASRLTKTLLRYLKPDFLNSVSGRRCQFWKCNFTVPVILGVVAASQPQENIKRSGWAAPDVLQIWFLVPISDVMSRSGFQESVKTCAQSSPGGPRCNASRLLLLSSVQEQQAKAKVPSGDAAALDVTSGLVCWLNQWKWDLDKLQGALEAVVIVVSSQFQTDCSQDRLQKPDLHYWSCST